MYNSIIAAAETATTSADSAVSQQGSGGLMSLAPMIIIFVVMFYFLFRSQKKQAQKRQAMIDKIVKGTDVIIAGGIHGTIVSVKDKTFIVQIADKVNVEITKAGVNGILGDNTADTK